MKMPFMCQSKMKLSLCLLSLFLFELKAAGSNRDLLHTYEGPKGPSADENSLLEKSIDSSESDEIYKWVEIKALQIEEEHLDESRRVEQEANKEKVLAMHSLKVLNCLGNRIEHHEQGLKSYTETLKILTKLLSIEDISKDSLDTMDQLYAQCRALKKKDPRHSQKIAKSQYKAFIEMIKGEPLHSAEKQAYRLLKGHLVDHYLFCGTPTIYDINAAFGVGLGVGSAHQVCIDPFGRGYQITTPYVSGSMGIGASISRNFASEARLYRYVKSDPHLFSGRVTGGYMLMVGVTGFGAWPGGEKTKSAGIGAGFVWTGQLGIGLKRKTVSLPYFKKYKKRMRTLNAYLAKNNERLIW